MTATEQFIDTLAQLKSGDLGLLRTHAGKGLDESVHAFDLFAGLWWPLREKSQRAPRREVAWLIAKLYASRPVPHAPDAIFARQLGRCRPAQPDARQRFQQQFDALLCLPLPRIEPALQWAIGVVASNEAQLDWVRLTDDLSIWELETTRLAWAEQFLDNSERG